MHSGNTEGAVQSILFAPIHEGADKLCIMTAQASPSMASWLMKSYAERGVSNISVEIIVGDTLSKGIDKISHDAYQSLQGNRDSTNYGRFTCCYLILPPEIRKNCYIWLHAESPFRAFTYSDGFTQSALLRKGCGIWGETSAVEAYRLYEKTTDRTIFCTHAEVEEYVTVATDCEQAFSSAQLSQTKCVHLPLVTRRTGETGIRSGLNWGQRGSRNRNEAYIPLPISVARSGFFPLDKQHFLVVTDDHHTLQLRVEQQNDKAITTPASNALLGEYFRNRLGLANGAYIHASDLRNYGRTDVTFYKIDEEQFYMDFSSPTRG